MKRGKNGAKEWSHPVLLSNLDQGMLGEMGKAWRWALGQRCSSKAQPEMGGLHLA